MSVGYTAGGQINQACFVTPMKGARQTVVQSVSQDTPCGIAGLGTRRDPDPDFAAGSAALALAISGDPVEVYQNGEQCLLLLGGNCKNGDFLKPDNNGNGVVSATVTGNAYGARALEDRNSGEYCLVEVIIGAGL